MNNYKLISDVHKCGSEPILITVPVCTTEWMIPVVNAEWSLLSSIDNGVRASVDQLQLQLITASKL